MLKPEQPQSEVNNEETNATPEEPYWGNTDLNPDNIPLKIDTSILSKEEVDDLLKANGAELFDSSKIAASDDGKEDKESDVDDSDDKEEGDKEKPASDDKKEIDAEKETAKAIVDTVKDLYKDLSIDEKTFKLLPEKVQEKLVDGFLSSSAQSEVVEKTSKEFEEFKETTNVLMQDTVIAARLKELESGGNLVAKDLPPVGANELAQIKELLAYDKDGDAAAKINELIRIRAQTAIQVERSVIDQRKEERVMQEDVAGVFKELGKLDGRLSLEEDDFFKLNPSHKEWSKFEKGIGEVKQYCINRGLTLQRIKEMGHKELYAAFAAHKGWDQERLRNAMKIGREEILKNIRNPKHVARTLDSGRRSLDPMTNSDSSGFDRDSLKKELVANRMNSKSYESLLKANEHNPKALDLLFDVFNEANRDYQEAEAISR